MAYKVGDKFIIEIEEVYAHKVDNGAPLNTPNNLYRMKGFNSLVFDENGLSKLEKYEESPFAQGDCDIARKEGFEEGVKSVGTYGGDLKAEAYQNGLNDAWEAARKIANMDSMIQKTLFEVYNCYPSKQIADVFENYSADEAISKIKAYEEQKKAEKEIKVGDEVLPLEPSEDVVIVTRKWIDDYDRPCIDVINRSSGRTWNYLEKDVHKTGRHFDIDGILKAMREE